MLKLPLLLPLPPLLAVAGGGVEKGLSLAAGNGALCGGEPREAVLATAAGLLVAPGLQGRWIA